MGEEWSDLTLAQEGHDNQRQTRELYFTNFLHVLIPSRLKGASVELLMIFQEILTNFIIGLIIS